MRKEKMPLGPKFLVKALKQPEQMGRLGTEVGL